MFNAYFSTRLSVCATQDKCFSSPNRSSIAFIMLAALSVTTAVTFSRSTRHLPQTSESVFYIFAAVCCSVISVTLILAEAKSEFVSNCAVTPKKLFMLIVSVHLSVVRVTFFPFKQDRIIADIALNVVSVRSVIFLRLGGR